MNRGSALALALDWVDGQMAYLYQVPSPTDSSFFAVGWTTMPGIDALVG